MILDDIQAEVERHAEEMEIEGIDALGYWARKLDITEDELYDFAEDRAKEMYAVGMSGRGVKQTLMSGWMDGFV